MRKPITFDLTQFVLNGAIMYLLYRVGGWTALGLFLVAWSIAFLILLAVALHGYFRK